MEIVNSKPHCAAPLSNQFYKTEQENKVLVFHTISQFKSFNNINKIIITFYVNCLLFNNNYRGFILQWTFCFTMKDTFTMQMNTWTMTILRDIKSWLFKFKVTRSINLCMHAGIEIKNSNNYLTVKNSGYYVNHLLEQIIKICSETIIRILCLHF